MRIKKINKFLDFFLSKSVIGITLAPFGIYVREDHLNDIVVINHEKIHWKQQMEMLILFFYIWYLSELLIRVMSGVEKAYYNLSMEREAYRNEKNLDYLMIRKMYSWVKYLKK
jgi:hypothetical protein